MPRIFISYRRSDTQTTADRICDEFKKRFGEENVFQDVGSIPFGIDFKAFIRREIEKGDVVIALIGKDWGKIVKELESSPDDFVRLEIELALQFNKLLIPVTINDTKMPEASELPISIRSICNRNAAKVRPNPDFHRDMEILSNGITISLELHQELSELSEVQDLISRDKFKSNWVDAQNLIFKHSQNAPDAIINLPHLMEYARFIQFSGNTFIMGINQPLYLEKLNDPIRIRWVRRALSKIMDYQVDVKYLLIDETNNIPKNEMDDIPF